jgi:lipopolysaccharide/colanic/teichoic acid biosynthesis glycosyltransferase
VNVEFPSGDLKIMQNGSPFTDRLIRSTLESALDDSPAGGWSHSVAKRLFDLTIAIPVLLVCALPMVVVAILIRLTSRGPAFFVQSRIGRDGRLFPIYKFRTMVATTSVIESGPGLTRDGDSRITGVGRWLRRLKLDEMPQFYNVLIGNMSIVGPRPKLPEFAAVQDEPYRPGITGAGSLVFRREEEILKNVEPQDLESFYQENIKPLKAEIDSCYMRQASLSSDIRVVVETFRSCMLSERAPADQLAKSAKPMGASSQKIKIDREETFEIAG